MSEIASRLPELLTEVSFFSEVTKTSLNNLCKNVTVLTFDKRDIIFNKGDEGDAHVCHSKG